jgi:tetratricopeptide (TPR) repeat protein
MSRIDKTTFDTIVRLIEPYMQTEAVRRQHIQVIFTGTDDELPRIDYTGDSITVAERMVFALAQYGKRKLWHLLKWRIYEEVGYQQKQQIDAWESLLNVDTLTLHSDIPQPEKPAQTTNIQIAGNVSGTNVNIGGTQTFQGETTINQTIQQQIIQPAQEKPKVRCPKPLDAPQKFGGRDQYYATLMTQLQARDASAVGISAMQGIGGIGKTTLARKVAFDLYQQQVFKAVVWTSVNQQPQIFSLLTHWGDYGRGSYAPTATDIEAVKAEVQTLLQAAIDSACDTCEGERVLLVLDDVWADGVQTVKTLLSIQPRNSTVLITTRSTNVLIDLDVDLPHVARLDYMQIVDAVQMLSQWLKDSDTALLERLAQALDGHPLSLELAAKRVLKESLQRHKSANDTLQRTVGEYETGLSTGTSFERLRLEQGEDKERNLTISLQLSYNTLSPHHQKQFRALGILPFAAPFDVHMLAALWAIDVADVDFHLSDLLDLALLEVEPDNEGWYRQHRLLRAYAFALLNQHKESESTFRRYAEHITKVAEFFDEKEDKLEEWGILDPYLPHIHQVGDELVQCNAADTKLWGELSLGFAVNTRRYLAYRPESLFAEDTGKRLPARLNWLEMGLDASRHQQNRSRESLFLNDLGFIHDNFGNKQQALDYFLQALENCREMDDKKNEAAVLSNVGTVYDDLGDNKQALSYYQQALPIQQEVGDRAGEATTLNNIGMVYRSLGDNQQALNYYQQALPIFEKIGHKQSIAALLNNVGTVYDDSGDKQQALNYYQQALPIRRQVGDKAGEATTLNNIAWVYHSSGDNKQALNYFQQVVDIFHQIGAVDHEVTVRTNVAVLKSSSNVDEAIHEMEQAIALLQSKNLTRDASGATLEDYEAYLADLKRRRAGG